MADQKTVIVTGFGPFGSHPVNASWETVKTLANQCLGDGFQLIIEEIPVDYEKVKKRVPELWNEHKPILVVHVGVSSFAAGLVLEQQAHNDGYNKIDVSQKLPEGEVCVPGQDVCLQSAIDMKCVCDKLQKSIGELKVEVSNDPGRYLCDFSYYTSLHIDRTRCAFIHLPPLDQPYSRERLAEGLRQAILSMLEQLPQDTNSCPAQAQE